MNEILLLVLTWLPVLAQSGLFAAIAKFIAKHFSIPEKLIAELKKTKEEIAKLNRKLTDLEEENSELRKEIHNNTLEHRGIKANESIKKN